MKSKVAAAIAIAFALAATTASAGVVISQERVVSNQGKVSKSEQTVMVQGNKRKVVTPERTVITDLDAGKVYFLNPKSKKYAQSPFPPKGLPAAIMVQEGLSFGFEKGAATHKVAGYECQDYSGSIPFAFTKLDTTQCVASDAPGAKEYTDFLKAIGEKIKGTRLAPKGGVIPDGVPVLITTSAEPHTFNPRRGVPPEQVKRIQDELAKHPPAVFTTTASKIEVKDLPADTFVVPADYSEQQFIEPKIMNKADFKSLTAPNAAGHGATITVQPAAPAAPH
jgi:hypothetical protein